MVFQMCIGNQGVGHEVCPLIIHALDSSDTMAVLRVMHVISRRLTATL